MSAKKLAKNETELVPLSSLKPHPRNYRSHPEEQLKHLCESIRRHGFYRNVVCAKDLTILAGHGVALAAAKLGIASVPIVRLPIAADSPQALKVLAADNETPRLSDNDDLVLAGLLRDIRDRDEFGLLGTGFDDESLAALLPPEPEHVEFDTTPKLGVEFNYQVIVECKSERDQATMIKKFEKAGLKCRPLIT